MKNEFTQKIRNTILQNNLISHGETVIVAVSGGADSVCLLSTLCELKDELGISIVAAHLNHLLRGDEATRDENFVCSLCAQMQVPFYSKSVDVKKLAKENKKTVEEAGRCARYEFFYELKDRLSADKIATAHNKNDNAETVCMRFIRGTGIDGLGGIPIKNNLCVIRPLLFCTREEIEAYLSESNISYVTDSSNLSDDYLRNRIRHNFLPDIMENYNENFVETLNENIAFYKEAGSFLKKTTDSAYENIVKRDKNSVCFKLKDLACLDTYILKSIAKKAIFEVSGRSVQSKTLRLVLDQVIFGDYPSLSATKGVTVYKKYAKIYFAKQDKTPEFSYVKDSDKIVITETNDVILFSQGEKISHKEKNTIFVKKSMLDGKKITVRNRRSGDKIKLKCGSKSIKNLFIDEKIPSFMRDEIPIVLADDEIIWVCTVRENPDFKAKDNEDFIQITYLKEKIQ
ncbi:MAG: tRNA lysidine(34) synthetase TilS [Clostridia bacterium]|nr:tRNA lysidine(34) synthetase TilS [Clostridia bacterium]